MNNKQTEALKMVTDILDDELWFPNRYPDEAIPICFIEALKACKEALEQPEVSDAELISYRQGYEQGRFDYEMDLELGKIEQPAQEPLTRAQQVIRANNSAQEPVALVYSMQDGYVGQMVVKDIPHKTKLYTHIAPSWQGLSDDEIHNYADHNFAFASEHFDEIFNFGRAIEQALKEKNI